MWLLRFGVLGDCMASAKSKSDINSACTAPIDRAKCCCRDNADGYSGCHNAKKAPLFYVKHGAKSQCLSRFLGVKRAIGDCLTIERRLICEKHSPVPPFVVACCAWDGFVRFV